MKTAINKMVEWFEKHDKVIDGDSENTLSIEGYKMFNCCWAEARRLASLEVKPQADAGLVEEITHELDECDLCQVPVRKSTIREILSRYHPAPQGDIVDELRKALIDNRWYDDLDGAVKKIITKFSNEKGAL